MSFYQTRRKPATDEAPAQPAERAAPGTSASALPFAAAARTWTGLRRAKPADVLLPASRAWFESLPLEVRPHALVTQYPRIVNLIAQQWNHYEDCCAYFEELLTDRRHGRQGFPADVHRDVRTLLEYYQRMRLSENGGLSVA